MLSGPETSGLALVHFGNIQTRNRRYFLLSFRSHCSCLEQKKTWSTHNTYQQPNCRVVSEKLRSLLLLRTRLLFSAEFFFSHGESSTYSASIFVTSVIMFFHVLQRAPDDRSIDNLLLLLILYGITSPLRLVLPRFNLVFFKHFHSY